MRRLLIIVIFAALCILTALGILKVDKNTKQVAGFLDDNTVFDIKDGTVTLFNEKIKLR